MKLGEITDLYEAMLKLSKLDLKFSEGYKISQITDACLSSVKFYNEQLLLLLKKYGKESEFEQGTFKIKEVAKYNNSVNELRNEEVEFKMPNIKLPIAVPVNDNLMLNADNIKNLTPYINFWEE